MTDTELKRRKAICEAAHVDEIDDVSDGFHTFRQLYYQRMMLFATIVKQNKDKAWKSLRHEDGELCFGGGWFIVGIDTPKGSYTYHYENKYWDMFDCVELPRGKHWDGHTEKDVTRLLSLPRTQLSQQGTTSDLISRQAAIDLWEKYHPTIAVDAMQYDAELRQLPPASCSEFPNSSDCISRQAAIDALDTGLWGVEWDKALATAMLKDLPSAQQWIPVTERLPKDIRPVIVTWKNTDPKSYYQYIVGKHFTGTACYKNGKWYWYSSTTEDMLAEYGRYDSEEFDEAIECIAWMPLPEPYKGEQHG